MALTIRYIVLFGFTILLSGCAKEKWDDCFTSTGPITEQLRTVGNFSEIRLYDRVNLVLEERSTGTLIVEAGRNLLGQIETDVSDGVLTIRNDNTCNWVRSFRPKITIKVSADQVARLELMGTGEVLSTATVHRSVFSVEQHKAQGSAVIALDVDTCYVGSHSGAGSITCTGSAAVAYLFSGIMGPIDAMGLDAGEVHLNNSGVADMRCHASSSLGVEIYGVGDVYYSGNPTITSNLQGSGQLIKVN